MKKLIPTLSLIIVALNALSQITYSPLYTETKFNQKAVDVSMPVGAIPGAASVSNSGAATYSILIDCPPGTNGMTPEIALVYNSQAGNGIMGMGWSVSGLSAITRVGKDIYHDGEVSAVDFSTNYRFALDGVRLILKSGNYGSNNSEYAAENEDFSVITYYKNGGEDYFSVRKKDGTEYQYGKVNYAYQTPGGMQGSPKYMTDDGGAVVIWRLNRIYDINRNYIDFEYINDFGNRYNIISKIRYTGNDNANLTPYYNIEFEYNGRQDITKLYDGGSSFSSRMLITKIHVKDNNSILRSYEFKYGTDNINSYLTEVTEKTSSQSLNSTIFKYGDLPHLYLQQSPTNISLSYQNPPNGSDNTTLIAGDFNGDGKSDFISAEFTTSIHYHKGKPKITRYYKEFTVYNKTATNNNYQQVYTRTLPQASYNHIVKDQNATNNYQFSKFDCDGDGLDDIVMVNSSGVEPTGTFKGVDVYYSIQSGTTFSKTSYSPPANYQRHVSTGDYVFWGDFDGDGKLDYITLLMHNTNYNDSKMFFSSPGNNSVNNIIPFSQDPFETNINPNLGVSALANADKAYVIDFDGDGKNEIMFINDTKCAIYTFKKNSSGGYEAKRLLLTEYPTYFHDRIWFGDFNGDGKTDILSKNNTNKWEIAYSTGKEWVNNVMNINFEGSCTYNCSGGVKGSKDIVDDILIGDFNGDGRSDIFHQIGYCPCRGYKSKIELFFSYGYNALFYSPPITEWTHLMSPFVNTLADVNGDGRADILYGEVNGAYSMWPPASTTYPILQVFTVKPNGTENLLEKIKDGFGNLTTFSYKPLTAGNTHYKKGTTAHYPLNDIQTALYTVSQLAQPDGIGSQKLTDYKYEGAIVHRLGRGFLGFSKIITNDQTTNTQTETITDADPTYYTPSVKEVNAYNTLSQRQVTHTTNNISIVQGTVPGTFYQQLLGQTESNLLTGATTTTTNTYDNNNFGTIVSSTTSINNAETITTTTAYTQPGSTTVPCMPELVTVTRQRAGQPAATDKTHFAYDGLGRVAEKAERYNTLYVILSTYNYLDGNGNDYGNITGEAYTNYAMSAGSPSSVSYQYDYDLKGRFRTSVTNPLGQVSYTTWDAVWGKPLTVTGVDGLVTAYTYDGWGKLTSTRMKANTPAEETLTYSDGWDISGNQLFYTRVSHPAKPDVKTWYDKLGRAVKTQTEHLGGQWTESTKTYDAIGNLLTETAPRLSAEPAFTTTYAYNDPYNRLTSAVNNFGTTSYSYSFLGSGEVKTTVLNPAGQSRSVTTDAAGKTIKEEDAGGALRYAYDSRGNLLSVHQNSMLLMMHTYNTIGLKTHTYDISAGTTAYTYNAFGKLRSEKDANGQTHSFVYNGLSALLYRTGPEGTTSYTYHGAGNGYANQLAYISGYNGVDESYDYDIYGRLTHKEKYIDGELYTTDYSYDNNNNLIRKAYGDGFYLDYTYDNGFLKNVIQPFPSLPPLNAPYLFKGTQINGQGQYVSYGLLNNRATTNTYYHGYLTLTATPGIQVLEMDYNYTTGNLNYRQDYIKNLKETFTYDNLNRLTQSRVGTGSQFNIAYDTYTGGMTRGNIISKTGVGTLAFVNAGRTPSAKNEAAAISEETQDITYTAFRKTQSVTETDAVTGIQYKQQFTYDAEYDRVKTELYENGSLTATRLYLDDYEVNIDPYTYNKQYIHYIAGGDGLCAIAEVQDQYYPNAGNATYHVIYKDHLGSIVTATDVNGTIEAEQNFDAWGRERHPATWQHGGATGVGLTHSWLYRGYTGHEHMPHFSIINMNGRMYDPVLGRMMSPDNYVHSGTQGYNRYSYAMNNPMTYIDPDGNMPAVVIPIIVGAAISAATYTAAAAAAPGGLPKNWNLGLFAFNVGMGAIGGAMTFGIGGAFGNVPFTYGMAGELGRSVAHGVNGYIFSGGNASGAAVGLITSGLGLATIDIPILNTNVGGTLFSAALGAYTAEMTGGEWWQGAAQAAAVHLLNQVAHKNYHPAPKEVPGHPEVGEGKYNPKSGRVRWKAPNGDIWEWDKQHGDVEVYDKSGKEHKGSFNPRTGKIKDPIPGRTTPKFTFPPQILRLINYYKNTITQPSLMPSPVPSIVPFNQKLMELLTPPTYNNLHSEMQ